MQRFYSFVSLPLTTGLLIAVSLFPAQAEPVSDYYLASTPEETLAPEGTTLLGTTHATHEESLNPSADLRTLPNESELPSTSRRAGSTRGGHITTAVTSSCTGDLTGAAISSEFSPINMLASLNEGFNPPTPPEASPSTSNRPVSSVDSADAIAALTWQLHPAYQFSPNQPLCE